MGTGWLWTVAARKVGIFAAGYIAASVAAWLGSDYAVTFFKLLSDVWGLTVTVIVDQAKLENRLGLVGVMAFVAAHDWLRLRFPDSKFL
ncbi:MAG: hypothetical protein U1E51_17690 [Candidatus Binatia bacterium]|nr:hypothetical protein [Candidatus Binatia bacterium]